MLATLSFTFTNLAEHGAVTGAEAVDLGRRDGLVRPLADAADDLPVVALGLLRRLGALDDAGAVLRLDQLTGIRQPRELELLEV
jgi:hypothetical protein